MTFQKRNSVNNSMTLMTFVPTFASTITKVEHTSSIPGPSTTPTCAILTSEAEEVVCGLDEKNAFLNKERRCEGIRSKVEISTTVKRMNNNKPAAVCFIIVSTTVVWKVQDFVSVIVVWKLQHLFITIVKELTISRTLLNAWLKHDLLCLCVLRGAHLGLRIWCFWVRKVLGFELMYQHNLMVECCIFPRSGFHINMDVNANLNFDIKRLFRKLWFICQVKWFSCCV